MPKAQEGHAGESMAISIPGAPMETPDAICLRRRKMLKVRMTPARRDTAIKETNAHVEKLVKIPVMRENNKEGEKSLNTIL